MKVCLVGHSAEGLLSASAGGAERQIALLARGLAARGHDVVLVATCLSGGERRADGVQVLPGWDADRGVRLVRAAYRYSHLYRVLLDEAADVYYARGAGYYTPFVIAAARAVAARSVLALASDRDLYASSGRFLFGVPDPVISALIGPMAHAAFRRFALRRADWIAVQNREQAASCSRLGLPHTVLPNIVTQPPEELAQAAPGRDIIWAGHVHASRRSKGLDELATLAQLLPEVSFTVAGRLHSPAHADTIRLLGSLPNVEMAGALSHADTQRCIADHRLVINTSPSEGFSNVMLEGWSLGRPAVTLAVNPSGLLDGDALGICARGDVEAMAAGIAALLEEPGVRASMGERARAYVRCAHAPDRVCAAFEELVVGGRCDPGA